MQVTTHLAFLNAPCHELPLKIWRGCEGLAWPRGLESWYFPYMPWRHPGSVWNCSQGATAPPSYITWGEGWGEYSRDSCSLHNLKEPLQPDHTAFLFTFILLCTITTIHPQNFHHTFRHHHEAKKLLPKVVSSFISHILDATAFSAGLPWTGPSLPMCILAFLVKQASDAYTAVKRFMPVINLSLIPGEHVMPMHSLSSVCFGREDGLRNLFLCWDWPPIGKWVSLGLISLFFWRYRGKVIIKDYTHSSWSAWLGVNVNS